MWCCLRGIGALILLPSGRVMENGLHSGFPVSASARTLQSVRMEMVWARESQVIVLEALLTDTREVIPDSPLTQWERADANFHPCLINFVLWKASLLKQLKHAPLLKRRSKATCTSSLWSADGLSDNLKSELGEGPRRYIPSCLYISEFLCWIFWYRLILKVSL